MLLLLFISLAFSRHITVLLDTATAAHNPELEEKTRLALQHARDRYVMPEDTLALYTFGGTSGSLRMVPPGAFNAIEFTIGCADWDAALHALPLSMTIREDVYLIVDENPCGPDPTPYARQLKKSGINLVAIGIGPGVDKHWLSRVSDAPISLSDYTNVRGHGLRDTVTTPITGWEIAAAVVVGVFIVVLVINSCIFACRDHKIKKKQKQPLV